MTEIKLLVVFFLCIFLVTLVSVKFSTKESDKEIFQTVTGTKKQGDLCLVYRQEYDISLMGLENLHPFDSKKWGKVAMKLNKEGIIANLDSPVMVSEELLESFMDKKYLDSLTSSSSVAELVEISPISYLPNFLLQRYLLTPMKYQVGGTILATKLALKHGKAVNIGGGFHHASMKRGGGFCVYPDITLAIREARKEAPNLRVLIIDLDAHQGNGHEEDAIGDDHTTILDIFNKSVYPYLDPENPIRKRIDFELAISSQTGTQVYLEKVSEGLAKAFEREYDLIIYNAGTDVLDNDPLGSLKVSHDGIIQRDEMVFRAAVDKGVPIVMLTSGGYLPESYEVIYDSICNLFKKGLLAIN